MFVKCYPGNRWTWFQQLINRIEYRAVRKIVTRTNTAKSTAKSMGFPRIWFVSLEGMLGSSSAHFRGLLIPWPNLYVSDLCAVTMYIEIWIYICLVSLYMSIYIVYISSYRFYTTDRHIQTMDTRHHIQIDTSYVDIFLEKQKVRWCELGREIRDLRSAGCGPVRAEWLEPKAANRDQRCGGQVRDLIGV